MRWTWPTEARAELVENRDVYIKFRGAAGYRDAPFHLYLGSLMVTHSTLAEAMEQGEAFVAPKPADPPLVHRVSPHFIMVGKTTKVAS